MYEQLENSLYTPSLGAELHQKMEAMVASPMMQFLLISTVNAWVLDEENWTTAWNFPAYTRLALIQNLAMSGITSIQSAADIPQSKGWTVTSIMARGVCIARLSYFALACGSFSDAFSNYRMLLDRELVLKHLDANKQYDAFAKAFYAEIYHRAGKGLSDEQLRSGYSHDQIEQSKQTMALIRTKYFDGKAPNAPGHYWKRPRSEDLAAEYANVDAPQSESARREVILRVYDLGNQNVHPQLRDMLQPEESDLTYEDMLNIVLVTLADLMEFGLSRFEASSALTGRVQEIMTQPIHGGTQLIEVIKASEVANQQAIEQAQQAPMER